MKILRNNESKIAKTKELSDNTPPRTPRGKYNKDIKKVADLRQIMSTLINQLRKNEPVDIPRAKLMIYAIQVMLSVLDQGEMEERLERLEQAVKQHQNVTGDGQSIYQRRIEADEFYGRDEFYRGKDGKERTEN